MRNLKKSLALFIVFVIVATMMVPAFAQSFTYSDQFNKLYSLGLISGTGTNSDGTPVASLDQSLTRETGVAMLVKLFVGQAKITELEAQLKDPTKLATAEALVKAKFKDADKVTNWAIPYIAYAIDQKMVEGNPDGTFAPVRNLSGRDFATMFLRQLGYTVSGTDWTTACNMLKEKGGLTADEATKFNEKALIRDDMVGIAFGTLSATNKDGVTLIKALVDAKVVDQQKALDAGLVVKTIKSVKAPANVPVEIGGTATMPTTVEATFEDNTTANVPVTWGTVDTSKEGSYDIKGTVKGFADGTTVKVIVQSKTFELSDATSTNLKEIVLTFNRVLNETTAETTTNYTGGIATPTSATLQADGKTVVLISSTTLTSYQTYSLVVANVKDANGNVITTQTKSFTASDNAVPQVASVVGKGNKKIEVTFSEPVQNISTANISNFMLDSAAITGTVTLGTDLRKATIVLTNPLLAGTHTLSLTQGMSTARVIDYAGYEAVVSSNTFTVSTDTTIPQITKVEATGQTNVNITFDEEMGTLTNTNIFWNTSGSETDNSRYADLVADENLDNTWNATFTTATPTQHYLPSGTVYLFIQNESDLNGNKIAGNYKSNIYRTQITVPASTIPTVSSVTAVSDKEIDVLFSDMVDSTTVLSSNFVVKDSTGTTMSGTPSLDLVTTSSTYKKKVTIAFGTPLTGGTFTVATTTSVKDIVGNYLAASSNTVAVTDTTQPNNYGTTTIAYKGTKAVITYPENMASTGTYSAADVSNYKWYNALTAVTADLPAGTYITKISDAIYRVEFPSTTTLAAGDYIVIGYFSGSTLKTVSDTSGNLYTPSNTALFGTAKGNMDISVKTVAAAPKLNITDANTLTFTLPTTESTLSAVLATDFEITKNSGTSWINPTSATISTDGKIVTFKVSDTDKFTAANSGTAVNVRTKATVTGTKDVFDTVIGASTTTSLTTANNIAAKLLTFAVLDADTILLKTDGTMDSTQVINTVMKGSLRVEQPVGVGKTISSVTTTNYKEFEITLSTDSNIDPAVDVTIKTLGADFITAKDSNGNMLAANTTGITLNKLAAYTATTVQAGADVASGDTMTVKFNRAISTTSIKDSWDGTSTAVTMTYNKTANTLTGSGIYIGTISGLALTTAADTGTVAGNMTYDSATRTLTVTFSAAVTGLDITNAGALFTPDANIKTSSGTSINTDFIADVK